jgi:putative serine protease PepD
VALAGLAIAGLLGVGFGTKAVLDSSSTSPTTSNAAPAAGAPATNAASASTTPLVNGADGEPVVDVANALGASVVLIKTEEGLGSGVVYDGKGLIMTNAHVVGTAKSVKVQFKDGTSLDGEVLGADTPNDIAVVQVQPTNELTVARLATDPPKVGQLAVGIGSPFGLDETVTAGVVSAVNRPVDNGVGGVASMIQTDAPINPGNSGGALANRRGEVIGINSMIYSEKGENNGIGFAIPIARAKSVADTLVSGGTVDRAYLGVGSQPTSDGSAGAEITKIDAASAAEKAGMKVGDVVVSVDGTTVKQASDLAAAVGTHQAGDTIKIEVQRGGTTTSLEVTLGSKPAGDTTQAAPQGTEQDPGATPAPGQQTPRRGTPPSTQPR